jgi:hypothetical protein
VTQSLVDTNTLVVANGASIGVALECQLAAVDELVSIKTAGALVLDEGREILAEYSKHCSYAGQPGVGDEFFRWAVENAALVETVQLTNHPDRRYEEFPDDAELTTFDWDDRVFVSASLASSSSARIVNAVDSDYAHHEEALKRHGVVVHELCPGSLKAPAS